jgi:hypothetical protein
MEGRLHGDEVGALQLRTRKKKRITTMANHSKKTPSTQTSKLVGKLVGRGRKLTYFLVPSLGSWAEVRMVDTSMMPS